MLNLLFINWESEESEESEDKKMFKKVEKLQYVLNFPEGTNKAVHFGKLRTALPSMDILSVSYPTRYSVLIQCTEEDAKKLSEFEWLESYKRHYPLMMRIVI